MSMTVNSRVDLELPFHYAGSEVFTAILLKIQVFSGVALFRSVNSSRRFKLSWCLHLQQVYWFALP